MDKPVRTDKREKIIESTLDLFGRTHNINKVSLEAIAKAAGVSPTTIYNLFGTREKLIFEVCKLLSLKNLEKNRRIIQSDLPFPSKLAAIIGGKQDLMARFDAELIKKIVQQDESMQPFIDEIYEREIKPLWLRVLQDGQAQGYIEHSVQAEAFLIYLDILKAGLAARQDLMGDLAQNPALIVEITKLMFFGFIKKGVDLFKEG
jgi:AcrR family transcriptional regulator